MMTGGNYGYFRWHLPAGPSPYTDFARLHRRASFQSPAHARRAGNHQRQHPMFHNPEARFKSGRMGWEEELVKSRNKASAASDCTGVSQQQCACHVSLRRFRIQPSARCAARAAIDLNTMVCHFRMHGLWFGFSTGPISSFHVPFRSMYVILIAS